MKQEAIAEARDALTGATMKITGDHVLVMTIPVGLFRIVDFTWRRD